MIIHLHVFQVFDSYEQIIKIKKFHSVWLRIPYMTALRKRHEGEEFRSLMYIYQDDFNCRCYYYCQQLGEKKMKYVLVSFNAYDYSASYIYGNKSRTLDLVNARRFETIEEAENHRKNWDSTLTIKPVEA